MYPRIAVCLGHWSSKTNRSDIAGKMLLNVSDAFLPDGSQYFAKNIRLGTSWTQFQLWVLIQPGAWPILCYMYTRATRVHKHCVSFPRHTQTKQNCPRTIMTPSNGNNFFVTRHLYRESTGHRWIPLTKNSDVELWCFIWSATEQRLSKQAKRWWFETPSGSLWRHCNDTHYGLVTP